MYLKSQEGSRKDFARRGHRLVSTHTRAARLDSNHEQAASNQPIDVDVDVNVDTDTDTDIDIDIDIDNAHTQEREMAT